MKDFDKFDKTCKKYGLSNSDQALLLQVTPVMISRYRNDPEVSMPESKWAGRLQVAVGVMKTVVANRSEPISKMSPSRRRDVLKDALVSQNPEIVINSLVH